MYLKRYKNLGIKFNDTTNEYVSVSMDDSIYEEIEMDFEQIIGSGEKKLYFDLTFKNLKQNEVLKTLNFKILNNTVTVNNDTYDLYKSVKTSATTYEDTLVAVGIACECIDGTEAKVLSIDLSNLGYEVTPENNKISFRLDLRESLNDTQLLALNNSLIYAEFVNKQDVNNSTKFDSYSIDEHSKVVVKRQDGEVYYNINLVNTVTKKNPVNVSLIGGKSLVINRNILSQPAAYNFDLNFIKEDNVIYKQNALGTLDRYYLVVINEGDEINVRYNDLINIKESKPLYYNDKDGYYIYDYSSGSTIKYKIFDKYSNYCIYQKNGDYFNLIETCNTQGRKTFYSWDTSKLIEVTNSDDNSVITLEYSTEGILEFVSEAITNMNVEITDTSTLLTLKYINGNSYTDPSDNTEYTHTDLYELKYKFNSNGYLTQVDETLSDKRLVLTYSNNKVSKVETKYKGTSTITGGGNLVVPTSTNIEQNVVINPITPITSTYKLLDSVQYEYNDDYTKITSFDGKQFYSYFDDLDRLVLELNENGKFTSYNYYGNTENLESNATTLDGKEKFIKNSSFELKSDGSLKDWIIPEDYIQGTWKLTDEGMYGKCLKITREDSSVFYLEQEIEDKFGPIDFIKGYYKFSSADTSSTIKVKLEGSYILDGSETVVNKEITLTYKTNWTLFTLDGVGIPEGVIFNGSILFEIRGNTTNDIYLDDIQFGDRITNFNLIKNGEMDSLDNWEITFLGTNDSGDLDYTTEQELEPCLGQKVLKLSLTNLANVSQVINHSGIPGDQFLLSTFVMFNYILSNRNNVVVELGRQYEDSTLGLTFESYESFKFDFDIIDKWNVLSQTFVATKSFTHIRIIFNFEGNGNIYVDSVKLLNTYKNNQFYYDEKSNIVEVVNSNQSITKMNYNQLNKVSYLSSGDVSYTFIYDEGGNLIEAIDSNGLKVEYIYDAYDNIEKETIKYRGEELTSSIQEHDANGNVIEYVDAFRKTITRTYDNLNRMTSETLPTNATFNYKYTPFNELEKISVSSLYNLMKYENGHKIKEVGSSGGEKYLFEYDEMDNLIKVSTTSGIILAEFEYEKETNSINTGLVTKKSYPVGGSYNFEYDDKYRLKSILYGTTLKYTYEYDENDNLSKIISSDETKYFFYDKLNNLVAIKSSKNNETHYIYDNLNNLSKKNYLINNEFRSVEYKHTYNNTVSSFEKYAQKYLNKSNHDILLGGKYGYGTNGLKAIDSTLDFNDFISNDGNKVFKFTKKNHSFKLNIDDVNKNLLSGSYSSNSFSKETFKEEMKKMKMIEFWIKPKGSFSDTNIMNVYGDLNGVSTLTGSVSINASGNLVFDNPILGDSSTVESTLKLNINKWNKISLLVVENNVGTLLQANINYVSLNNSAFLDNFFVSSYGFNTIQFGSESTDTTSLSTSFEIAMISIGTMKEDLFKLEWYIEGLKALNNAKTSITDKTVFIDTSLSSSFEVYSLEGDVYSSRNNKMILEHNNDYSPFEYDKDEDKLVYSSYKYKESFIYLEPKITNVGVVSFDFKVDSYSDYSSLSSDDKNDIFTLNGRHIFSSAPLKLFIANNNLIFYQNDQYTNLGTFTNYDIWNKLTLILYPGTNRCSLYLNDELLFSSTGLRFITNDRLYLGSQMNVKDTQFGGQIKNLLVSSNAYSTAAKQYDLVESLLNHSNKYVEKTYNQLNMLVNKDVNDLIKTEYTYNKTKLTKESSEYFVNNYTFNDIGNLTNLTINGVNGGSSHQYGYDSYNRLRTVFNSSDTIQEQITLNYDNNGNIRTRVVRNMTTGVTKGETFNYDSYNRLIGMKDGENEYILQYSNASSPNPNLLVKNNTPYYIYYEGKRIVRINDNQYFYNEEGIRTRKVIVNNSNGTVITEIHDYILEGNKIIKETVSGSRNYVLNFDYDMHGELIGFEYNKNSYFYVRDALGNINHIIDSSGNLMISYKYDEWGKLIDTITTSTFALILSGINPFIYKGYYYDKETQLYWVSSRYYSPELCRWISPDSIEYLDPESINGLNLYAYCNNDPVNKYDPSGHFAISALIIGAIIGAAIGFGGTVLADYVDDGQIFNGSISAGSYIANTLVGGLIGGLTGGIASSSFTFTYPTLKFAQMATTEGLILGSVSVGTATATISGVSVVTALGLAGVTVMAARIGKSGGYRIDHHYPNDHAPTHVHISGDDGTTRVDINGNPIQGDRPMTPGEKKAFWRLIEKIIEALKPWM